MDRTLTGDALGVARLKAVQYSLLERMKLKLYQQVGAFQRLEIPEPFALSEWVDGVAVAEIQAQLDELSKAIAAYWSDTQVAAFVANTMGLGPAVFRVLSRIPALDGFEAVAKVWRYVGLHPAGAREDRRYNAQVKAWCLFRIAEPCMKAMKSPYRAVYDARKVTRPLMDDAPEDCPSCLAAKAKRKATGKAGWDCHNMGGPHYKKGHAHVDALRVTAKAVLRDCWRVAHGQEPRYGNGETIMALMPSRTVSPPHSTGGQYLTDTHLNRAAMGGV